jgi:pSer/pThr/pTyr-binding forkhead associated (FHA) protein
MNFALHFKGNLKQSPIEVVRSVVLVGRHPECDVRLKIASVSRRHCCLVQVDQDLYVRDLGSLHGVWVNGRRVVEQRLELGDELAIGPVFLKVRTLEQENPEKPLQPEPGSDNAVYSGSLSQDEELDFADAVSALSDENLTSSVSPSESLRPQDSGLEVSEISEYQQDVHETQNPDEDDSGIQPLLDLSL